jgi:hypothetical protein
VAALSKYPVKACAICGYEGEPGEAHTCKTASRMLPHDQAALAFQRLGVARLAAELKETP